MSDLVRVALVDNEPSAELAVGLLRTEGITAMWRGGAVAGVQGHVEVLVRPEHAERARELLAEEE